MRMKLPRSRCDSDTLERLLRGRRTSREFSTTPIALGVLGLLLWAGQGLANGGDKRVAPSAGGQYPLQLFVVATRVSDLSRGAYRYDPEAHALEAMSADCVSHDLYEAAIGDQPWIRDAALVVVVGADLESMNEHFREQEPRGARGARYAYIETGTVAQNLHLQAEQLGLGLVLVGGFDDARVKQVLQLPRELEPTALICLGTTV